jgi:hypothetical protein
VIATLLAEFEREEKVSFRGGRYLYTRAYGVLAKYLASLGDQRVKDLYKRYQHATRPPRDRGNGEQ